MKRKVTKGMRFRSPYADANPLWETKKSLGKTWLCEIVNEPIEYRGQTIDSDWVGVQKPFLIEDILALVSSLKAMNRLVDSSDQWYNSLPLNTVVHYDNGFGSFVRCSVVGAPKARMLKPIALVGNWHAIDLPVRRYNGTVSLGVHAQNIAEGKCFQPHYANVYESPEYTKKGPNPVNLKPVDLTVPDMTAEEAEAARLWTLIEEVKEALAIKDGDDNSNLREPAIPEMLLKRAITKLKEAGLKL